MATAQNGTVTATTITDANNSTQEPATALGATTAEKRWPGWPGECVFRLIVPMGKVGSIIGRKGELVKKTCEDTRARIRVLDAPLGTPDRVVLITGKEEPEAALSPAMDATIRIFKRISGLSETDSDNKGSAGVVFCSIRLLVASTQAVNLIGKQGSLIKSMQESSGASIRVLSADETQFHAATTDERIVELQGEALKVLKALEAVVGHLRRFLVDHSVLPLFEKPYTAPTTQPHQAETLADKSLHIASQTSIFSDISLPTKRDSVFADRGSLLDSLLPSSTVSVYGQDSSLSAVRSSALTPLSRAAAPIVSTVVQTMQIPLSYAEDIIGVQGTNIEYIRRTSGAILTVQESRVPDEIVVEIKGSSSQVQTAEQLIQEVISNHKDPVASSYGRVDAGLRSSYAAVGETGLGSSYSTVGDTGLRSSYATLGDVGLRNSYSTVGTASRPAPSLTSQPYSGYGASSLGDYSTFRL
ncbi:hypothetical protein HN51_004694 [Arachis hypogaea]|uniref:K Homology domain-containing protein n=2 Tax=Arachis TaxID=3817 RepID=A0A445DHP9_ARAHY|nr:RNA-binding KH domain-containing protein PEPPER [Arachis duranensis]XP_025694962.1 RNA-binding KH domain-containing protein PEPPER [Arachis hypogaea]QHO38308.1 RNA-binding KH domain-containing protein PEPPER [Arachis hypogaea]RYR62632.1 hypothetical protein Ahy_A04g020336 [Arachis hypogaea]